MQQTLVSRIAMVIIMQRNLAEAVEFYKKLGFKLKFHLKDKWAEFELDDTKIGLCPTDEEPGLIRTGIVLQVQDLKAIYENNKDWIKFFDQPHEAAHGIMVSFQDPSGNVLDLYQPTPEKVQELIKKSGAQVDDACCKSEEKCC